MMNKTTVSLFKPDELDRLTQHFRLTEQRSADQALSIPAADLLDASRCRTYLERVQAVFQAPSPLVNASQFAKRYSFLAIVPALYAMSIFNKGLDLSVENCHIESEYTNQIWLPKVRLTKWHVTQPMDGGRQEWRDQVIRSIFAGNVAKVWQSVSVAANIPKATLWENAAVYVYWLYEKGIGTNEGTDAQERLRIEEDYRYLLQEAPPSLFGEKENPLGKYNGTKCSTPASDQPVRIRKTCCYYYEISPDQANCSTCPRSV
jgi:ferric iron reductase protein FhuF